VKCVALMADRPAVRLAAASLAAALEHVHATDDGIIDCWRLWPAADCWAAPAAGGLAAMGKSGRGYSADESAAGRC